MGWVLWWTLRATHLCAELMGHRSDDRGNSGDHGRNPCSCHPALHHRCAVLLPAAGGWPVPVPSLFCPTLSLPLAQPSFLWGLYMGSWSGHGVQGQGSPGRMGIPHLPPLSPVSFLTALRMKRPTSSLGVIPCPITESHTGLGGF